MWRLSLVTLFSCVTMTALVVLLGTLYTLISMPRQVSAALNPSVSDNK